MKVLILGMTGMLGGAVAQEFANFHGQVVGTSRHQLTVDNANLQVRLFDAETGELDELLHDFSPGDFIVNCIGIIKTEIDEQSSASRARALSVNSEFPERLSRFAEARGLKVIQIATDCVFSGEVGHYSELSTHDFKDWYGETKSRGEISSPSVMHLRVSIIGVEKRGFTSLYEWVARQERNAQITGFTNHFWNGIPAKHFGKISRAIIENGLFKLGVHHLVPADEVSKANLVRMIAKHANRSDIKIVEGPAPTQVDRTLATVDPAFNALLWQITGYSSPPSIKQLVSEI